MKVVLFGIWNKSHASGVAGRYQSPCVKSMGLNLWHLCQAGVFGFVTLTRILGSERRFRHT